MFKLLHNLKSTLKVYACFLGERRSWRPGSGGEEYSRQVGPDQGTASQD